MPRSLSPEAFRQMFAQEQTDVFLMCLTIEHDDLDEPIRVVKNKEDLVRSEGTYLGTFFDLNLPEDNPEQVPQVTLTIDNVNKAISRAIQGLAGRVRVRLEVVLESQPNTVEAGPFDFFLLGVNITASTIQGTLGFEDDVLNQAFPVQTYTPDNTPGLFR